MFLLPVLAVPGVAELITIVVVVFLLLVIMGILNHPFARVPDPYKTWATWVVVAILVIFLIWQALQISGLM